MRWGDSRIVKQNNYIYIELPAYSDQIISWDKIEAHA